jgi:hypothetical protein
MSDHNFEKQIQQKLDELKIPPADTVWSAVQDRIRKDKRRRRGLVLFPLLFLFLGAASYFILEDRVFEKTSASKLAVADSTSQQTNIPKDGKLPGPNKPENIEAGDIPGTLEVNQNASEGKNPADLWPKEEIPLKQKEQLTKSDFKGAPANVNGNDRSISKRVSVTKDFPKQPAALQKSKGENTGTNKDEDSREIIETHQQPTDDHHSGKKVNEPGPVTQSQIEHAGDSLSDNKAAVDSTGDLRADSATQLTKKLIADSVLLDVAASPQRSSEEKVNKKKIKWGFNASAGISNVNDRGFFSGGFLTGVFAEENVLVADVYDRSAFNNPTMGNIPGPIVHKPSAIEKGFSFSAGAFFEKNVSKRLSISTGLQYTYYTNSIRVGSRVDSFTAVQNVSGPLSVNQYYRSAAASRTYQYTNRYHFIDLPVMLHIQLNRGNHLPILWNGGLSLSYLISTSALHFDSRTGVYYKDNSLFNKLQANLSTGVSFSFFNRSALPLQLGPELRYGLTNLLQKQVSQTRHLLYFGLNTRVYFGK